MLCTFLYFRRNPASKDRQRYESPQERNGRVDFDECVEVGGQAQMQWLDAGGVGDDVTVGPALRTPRRSRAAGHGGMLGEGTSGDDDLLVGESG